MQPVRLVLLPVVAVVSLPVVALGLLLLVGRLLARRVVPVLLLLAAVLPLLPPLVGRWALPLLPPLAAPHLLRLLLVGLLSRLPVAAWSVSA